jgi:hypothetical protein
MVESLKDRREKEKWESWMKLEAMKRGALLHDFAKAVINFGKISKDTDVQWPCILSLQELNLDQLLLSQIPSEVFKRTWMVLHQSMGFLSKYEYRPLFGEFTIAKEEKPRVDMLCEKLPTSRTGSREILIVDWKFRDDLNQATPSQWIRKIYGYMNDYLSVNQAKDIISVKGLLIHFQIGDMQFFNLENAIRFEWIEYRTVPPLLFLEGQASNQSKDSDFESLQEMIEKNSKTLSQQKFDYEQREREKMNEYVKSLYPQEEEDLIQMYMKSFFRLYMINSSHVGRSDLENLQYKISFGTMGKTWNLTILDLIHILNFCSHCLVLDHTFPEFLEVNRGKSSLKIPWKEFSSVIKNCASKTRQLILSIKDFGLYESKVNVWDWPELIRTLSAFTSDNLKDSFKNIAITNVECFLTVGILLLEWIWDSFCFQQSLKDGYKLFSSFVSAHKFFGSDK